MAYRVDDPRLLAKAATVRDAGYAYTDQHDLRLYALELEVERLAGEVKHLEHRLERDVETLGDGLEQLELRLEGEDLEAAD